MVAELAGIQRNIEKAVGIDNVTKEEYEKNLDENLKSLVAKMKSGAYKPQPSRRIYIPKDSKGKMRPLGISNYEDKLVEAVIAEILTKVYEPKFYDYSYGFRPNRSCHMAVREVIKDIQLYKTSWVVEADIKGFFDHVSHEFAKYGLSLAEEKTKILEFGRYAARKRAERGLVKPETFDFLGFTFYCSMNTERTFYRCKVKTSRKKLRNKIRAMKEWIRNNRNMPLEWLFKKINEKLRGHYQYYAVTDNIVECKRFQRQTTWYLYKYLNRRSQKRSYNHDTFFNGLLKTFPLVDPRIRVSLAYR